MRSIKCTIQMHQLRCKSPELVHKETWTHILAYNPIRTIIAQAAATHDLLPRSSSFKRVCQTLEAFQPVIECTQLMAQSIAGGCTKTYSTPSLPIEWPTALTASSLA